MNNLARRYFMGGKKEIDITSSVFEVETNSPDQTFEITLFADGNYNFEADWGDGQKEMAASFQTLTHTYANTGNYDVVLTGTIDGIEIKQQSFPYGNASLKYIKQWGATQNWGGFTNCRDLLEDLSPDVPKSFRNNSMRDFFYNCFNFIGGQNINNWNTSGITNFFQCFRDSDFNSNIENWDVSLSTNFAVMFYGTPFNQPLNGWDVSNCLDFRAMFALTTLFNQPLDLWVFNATNFVSLSTMFDRANAFNNNSILSWDMSRVNNVEYMFRGNTAFNQPIGTWDMSNVTKMQSMFENNTMFNQDISAWNVSKVTSIRSIFRNSNFNSNINGWDLASCADFYTSFFRSPFNQPLDLWKLSVSTSLNINCFSMFRECPFNQNISSWNTSRISHFESMFKDNSNFNQPIGTWDVSYSTIFSSMFKGATAFNQDISGWNVTKCTNFGSGQFDVNGGMFEGAIAFNQNLSTWIINSTTAVNFIQMFKGATAFNQDLGSWKITTLVNATEMFSGVILSTANYDALLVGWESQKPDIQLDVAFSGGNSKYTSGSAAATARQNLITDHSWSITDGGAI